MQEYYSSISNGTLLGDTSCGIPLIKFVWDDDTIASAPYCDWYVCRHAFLCFSHAR